MIWPVKHCHCMWTHTAAWRATLAGKALLRIWLCICIAAGLLMHCCVCCAAARQLFDKQLLHLLALVHSQKSACWAHLCSWLHAALQTICSCCLIQARHRSMLLETGYRAVPAPATHQAHPWPWPAASSKCCTIICMAALTLFLA
jgi:hypothetical protein